MFISVSVHDIVDTLERRGHIDNRIFNYSTMEEGSRIHSSYQKKKDSSWVNEYPISFIYEKNDLTIKVTGRADSVKLFPLTVEEIKSTIADLDEFFADHSMWHLSQCMFYAYCICKERNEKNCELLLTYIKQGATSIMKTVSKKVTFKELQSFIDDLMERYVHYIRKIIDRKNTMVSSIKDHLSFPFSLIREGQKEMMNIIENTIDENKKIYIEAPTGTGKTIAALYPTIKKLGERKIDSIYYLTSKNVIKNIACNTLKSLIDSKVKITVLEMTSKENICPNDKKGRCNPDECIFARNYYDTLIDNIFDLLSSNYLLNRENIESFSLKKEICPHQFQLDIKRYCDIVIMDYNYIFDFHNQLELLALKEDRLKITPLIDECHNLPERVKKMYSLAIYYSQLLYAKHLLLGKEFKKVRDKLDGFITSFSSLPIDYDDSENLKNKISIIKEIPEIFYSLLEELIDSFKSLLKKNPTIFSDKLLEFYFDLNSLKYLIEDSMREDRVNCYLIYIMFSKEEISSLRIVNINPTPIIQEVSNYFPSVIYFSATLSPKEYYHTLLGGKNIRDDLKVISSPFDKKRRLILVDSNLSLKYKDRNDTISAVFNDIINLVQCKKGNYMIFSPSFQYLSLLQACLEQYKKTNDISLIVQTSEMDNRQREEFLSNFKEDNNRTTIGLVVLGGIFSEGIDLKGDKLIGAIVISVGIPNISFEKDQEKNYFSKDKSVNGYDYAYSFPGMNKVLQASGRVIRSEEDKGIILLIDSRYKLPLYKKLLDESYPDYKMISSDDIIEVTEEFWRNNR